MPNHERSFINDENNDQQVSISEISPHEASTEKETSPKDFQLELTKLKYSNAAAATGGKQSMAFSYDTIETGSSTDEEKSNGSEFGECVSAKDLKNKLPQVEKEMAEILKLKVN